MVCLHYAVITMIYRATPRVRHYIYLIVPQGPSFGAYSGEQNRADEGCKASYSHQIDFLCPCGAERQIHKVRSKSKVFMRTFQKCWYTVICPL